jgi:signal transduction histidine kinase/DNA-binding response OmpR family regulator
MIPKEVPSPDRNEAAPATPPTILIVDDHPANLIAFEATLAPLGLPVVTVTSGEEALRLLLQREFALVVLDVQMPGMSGFELAALLRSHTRLASLPIIFVTAISRDAAHVFAGYAHGAVDYLLKPVEPEILRAKVNVFVELYRRHQTIRAQAELLHRHELRELERRSEERFRRLTELIPLPVWGVGPEGNVYVCNGVWTEYAGVSAEQTGALLSPDWIHPLDIDGARAEWSEGTRAGRPFDLECRLRRGGDGAFRWHLLRAVPDRGERGPEGCWIVAGVDIDAQKTADEHRAHLLEREQRAREAAESANRMKDEFLATVSHELRTPLNAILGWTRIIRSGKLDQTRVAQAMETIERNAQIQIRLVSDILDLSQIVMGKPLLHIGLLNLCTVVSDAVETVRPSADARGIDLCWQPSHGDATMVGDASRLQQVVWNLLANAVKFTPKGGRVEIRLECSDHCACITVDDTGAGIGSEFLPYVFDRFRQGDGTPSGRHEGLGLGLAIVKHVVELHGGHVTAESAGPGKGAKFTLTIPNDPTVDRAGTAAKTPMLRSPSPAPRMANEAPCLAGVTVLFVDDQPDAPELVDALFSRHGARVVVAKTAEQALGAMRAAVPDVLISDIGFADEDGHALMRHVRALDPSAGGTVPAIALTAYGRADDGRRAKDEGFQVHIAKPVEPDELLALVSSLLIGKSEPAQSANGHSAETLRAL